MMPGMPRYQSAGALRRQRELTRTMADDFDATLLHNTVYDEIGEDPQLAQLLEAAERTRQAQERRETDLGEGAERVDEIADAAGTLSHVARTRALEVVAEACQRVIEDADQWVKEGVIGKTTAEAARTEAREWVQRNATVTDRLGVLKAVSGDVVAAALDQLETSAEAREAADFYVWNRATESVANTFETYQDAADYAGGKGHLVPVDSREQTEGGA